MPSKACDKYKGKEKEDYFGKPAGKLDGKANW